MVRPLRLHIDGVVWRSCVYPLLLSLLFPAVSVASCNAARPAVYTVLNEESIVYTDVDGHLVHHRRSRKLQAYPYSSERPTAAMQCLYIYSEGIFCISDSWPCNVVNV